MSPDLHCGCDRCRGRELKPLPNEPIKKDLPGQERFDFDDFDDKINDDEWLDEEDYEWNDECDDDRNYE